MHGRCFEYGAVLLAAILCAGTARADGWTVMPWYGGSQQRPALAADGTGGAWLAFECGDGRVGLARLAPDGRLEPAWPYGLYAAGVTLQPGSAARLLASGPDRVAVVSDYCNGDPLAMAYDGAGEPVSGFPVYATKYYNEPGVVLGADGRILMAATASFSLSQSGVRYAVIPASGVPVLEADVTMGVHVPDPFPTSATSDGAGGMYVGFQMFFAEDRSTGFDLGLMRVAGDGTRPWPGNWKTVCSANTNQDELRMAPDGAGGVLLA